jgi:tetratricopeptide (TPR) repeat protein
MPRTKQRAFLCGAVPSRGRRSDLASQRQELPRDDGAVTFPIALRPLVPVRIFGVVKLLTLFASTFVAVVPVFPANGQNPATGDTLSEAVQLRNSGQLASAATLLRSYWAGHRSDPNAALLYGETLYWLKRFDEARAVYEAGVSANPDNLPLALSFGRMLIETGDGARARTLLEPFQGSPSGFAPSSTLLGTLAYWEGDLTTAARLFREALRANPEEHDAARQLEEIRVLTSSWLRLGGDGRFDDQPLHRIAGDAQAGWYVTELAAISARVRPMYFQLGDSLTRTITQAEGELSFYSPATHVEISLAGGGLTRSYDVRSDWTARVVLGIRMPQKIVVRAQAERSPYLYTLASLTKAVMTRTFSLSADWNDPSGWIARALVQRELYPDVNAISTVYGWVLAPLVHRAEIDVQLGVSASAQDADENRFALARPVQPYPVGDSRFSTAGIYNPYYTPSSLSSESVVGAIALRPSSDVTFRAGGGYAIRATDNNPSFSVLPASGTQPATLQQTFQSRTFSPWTARASIEAALTGHASFMAGAEYGKTPFYSATTAETALIYHFHSRSQL